MKTILLTVDDLVSLKLSNPGAVIRLYYKKNETIPVSEVALLHNMDVQFIEIDSFTDLVFDIGMVVGEQKTKGEEIELFYGPNINIPEQFVKSLGIKKLGSMKQSSATKLKKDTEKKPVSRKKSQQKETISNIENVKNGTKKESVKLEPEMTEVPKKRGRKKGDAQKTESKETVVTVEETKVIASKPEETIKKQVAVTGDTSMFLKQMSVRGSDLVDESVSDDELLQSLIQIFKDARALNPKDLVQMLFDRFSENDAEIIYKWVKPNAKRLHALAQEIE